MAIINPDIETGVDAVEFSSADPRSTSDYPEPHSIRLLSIAFAVVAAIGIFTNGSLLALLWLLRKSESSSSTHVHIGNQTALELWACIFMLITHCMKLAGRLEYGKRSVASDMALCILFDVGILSALGVYGSRFCLMIIALDLYFRIVHPIKHRKYYRRWVMYVGLVIPWINGILVYPLPVALTAEIVDGVCEAAALGSRIAAVFNFTSQILLPLVVSIYCYWKIVAVIRRQLSEAQHRGMRRAAAATASETAAEKQAGPSIQPDDDDDAECTPIKLLSAPASTIVQSQDQTVKKLDRAQMNIVKAAIFVVVFAMAFCMPIYVVFTLTPRPNYEGILALVSAMLYHLNMSVNPFIYMVYFNVGRNCWNTCAGGQQAAAEQ